MTSKILVGNISPETSEDLIRELFTGTGGKVMSVSIPLEPKSQKNRGYAFVEMADDVEAENAVRDLNGTPVDGRPMAITIVERIQGKRKWYKLGAR